MGNNMIIHDELSEKAVLGTLLSKEYALDEVREILNEECFYNDFHKKIYRAILQVDSHGDSPDIITVLAEAKKTDPNTTPFAITELTSASLIIGLYQHAARLYDLSVKRKLWEIGQKLIVDSCSEIEDNADIIEEVRKSLEGMYNLSSNKTATMLDAVQNIHELINLNISNVNQVTRTRTGFKEFDKRSGGLQATDFVVIAAEYSQGKTSFAISLCMNAMESGAKIAFYSMEMTKEQLTARMLAAKSGVSSSRILYAPLLSHELQQVDSGMGKIIKYNLVFDDRDSSNIDIILSSIRAMKIRHDINGAVIDYLQILNVNMKGANKEQQMAEVSRRLKNLAKEIKIWIIALSQLSRDKDNPVPSLNRLRDSGQIAEAADIVLLIYRPECYGRNFPKPYDTVKTKGIALIDIAKGRNIGTGKFFCGFDACRTLFYELENAIEPKSEYEPF
ncbi:Replicative DNA helicase [termite gut metagenome]|uniref:DNA 5'-3' helicase n=1 Tax=termite gut metagenome TaxID=433724 RepID=A0A5J4RVY6_9ZZZZ